MCKHYRHWRVNETSSRGFVSLGNITCKCCNKKTSMHVESGHDISFYFGSCVRYKKAGEWRAKKIKFCL